MAIINQHSHRSLNTSLPAFTFQYPLKENKQRNKADASNEPKHSTEDTIIATYRPEIGTSLENGGKTINNVELNHEKALNNIDTHESLSFQLSEKGKTNREENERLKEQEVRLSVDNNEVSLIHSSKHKPQKRNIPARSVDNNSNTKVELKNKELFFEQSNITTPVNRKK